MSTLLEMKYDTDDFADLLEEAEMEADTAWEMDFVEDMTERFTIYRASLYLSEKQLEMLRRIAKV